MFFGPAANSLFASSRCSNMPRRMRERRFDTVAADRAASDQRNGDTVERLGDARQSISIYGSSEKQFGQRGHLERERSRGWRSADRNDHDWWCLYGTRGPADPGQPDDNGDQPRGRQQIRIGNLPASPNVTLTARSVADSSRQVSAAITITSNFLLQLSVPSTVPVSSTVTFIATLKPVGIKSEHSFLLELIWERMQRIFVWDFERGNRAIRGRKCHGCIGKLHGTDIILSAACHRGYRHAAR